MRELSMQEMALVSGGSGFGSRRRSSKCQPKPPVCQPKPPCGSGGGSGGATP